jgi:predicted DNA-binding transcriptional regulator AlpA
MRRSSTATPDQEHDKENQMSQTNHAPARPETVRGIAVRLTYQEVEAITRRSRWTIRRMWKAGSFPPPIGSTFRADWVQQWQEGKTDWTSEAEQLRKPQDNGARVRLLRRARSAGGR